MFRRLARRLTQPQQYAPWDRRPSGLCLPKWYHEAGGEFGPWGDGWPGCCCDGVVPPPPPPSCDCACEWCKDEEAACCWQVSVSGLVDDGCDCEELEKAWKVAWVSGCAWEGTILWPCTDCDGSAYDSELELSITITEDLITATVGPYTFEKAFEGDMDCCTSHELEFVSDSGASNDCDASGATLTLTPSTGTCEQTDCPRGNECCPDMELTSGDVLVDFGTGGWTDECVDYCDQVIGVYTLQAYTTAGWRYLLRPAGVNCGGEWDSGFVPGQHPTLTISLSYECPSDSANSLRLTVSLSGFCIKTIGSSTYDRSVVSTATFTKTWANNCNGSDLFADARNPDGTITLTFSTSSPTRQLGGNCDGKFDPTFACAGDVADWNWTTIDIEIPEL